MRPEASAVGRGGFNAQFHAARVSVTRSPIRWCKQLYSLPRDTKYHFSFSEYVVKYIIKRITHVSSDDG